ncbi:myb/SANT-like DNA-binding domain-containing protein 3 [Periplaneta americana]|uniref:myb/SANT-like DNA-binding domain-containing protein 3 n=1 Tax=Periplaneta americana TaxID=6978 RepID=UPI0037E799FA
MAAKRGKNFDDFEKNFLIELIADYKHIIENKKTDSVTVRTENKAWEEIAIKYNASCRTGPRSAKQLHALYNCMKKAARKDLNRDKMERYKTGGGVFIPNLSETGSKIINLLQPQFKPLDTAYDSSAQYFGHDDVIYEVEVDAADYLGTSGAQDNQVDLCVLEDASLRVLDSQSEETAVPVHQPSTACTTQSTVSSVPHLTTISTQTTLDTIPHPSTDTSQSTPTTTQSHPTTVTSQQEGAMWADFMKEIHYKFFR